MGILIYFLSLIKNFLNNAKSECEKLQDLKYNIIYKKQNVCCSQNNFRPNIFCFTLL